MREGPLSNSSNTVPWVKVPHKKTSKTNVRECFFRYSLWLFISDLEAPATTQCPSDATQERAPLPYCFNRNSSWWSWKRAWRSKSHLTRVIQNQDVFRNCHQNLVPENLQDTTYSTMSEKWLETLTLCAPPPPSCCLSLSSSVFFAHTHSIPVVWQILTNLKSTVNKWWKKGGESHRWLWQWQVFSLLNLHELRTQPDSESKSIVKLEDFK